MPEGYTPASTLPKKHEFWVPEGTFSLHDEQCLLVAVNYPDWKVGVPIGWEGLFFFFFSYLFSD